MIHYCEPPHTWESWQAKYRKLIRTCVDWDQLQKPTPKVGREIIFADDRNELISYIFFPWFKKSWRKGKPREALLGRKDVVISAPAVHFNEEAFLLLDSCHRVRDLKPKVLILDWIMPRESQLLCCFNDLVTRWWEELI